MAGNWKLIYSTISILGSRRTKLGLRDFITLGDLYQNIDISEVCYFNLRLRDLIILFFKILHKNEILRIFYFVIV